MKTLFIEGKVMIRIVNRIAYDVLSALYQPFWAAVLFAFFFMYVYLYGKEHNWNRERLFETAFFTWTAEFKRSSLFRRIFFLAFYTALILFRTVLNRKIWFDPLGKLFGGWGLYENGKLTTEAIENFMLFIPFSVLLLWAFGQEVCRTKHPGFFRMVWQAGKIVAIFSFCIELSQLLFHLGTFQFSDLCYNTLGGMLGGVFYCGMKKIKEFF